MKNAKGLRYGDGESMLNVCGPWTTYIINWMNQKSQICLYLRTEVITIDGAIWLHTKYHKIHFALIMCILDGELHGVLLPFDLIWKPNVVLHDSNNDDYAMHAVYC